MVQYTRIQLQKCVVYLTAEEINQLLMKDLNLFQTALKRGKGFTRNIEQKQREKAKFEESERQRLKEFD